VDLVSRRLRRLPAALLPVVLLAGLTACGGDDSSSSQPLDAVSISGPVGKEPKVTWKGEMESTSVETSTLTKGDGAEIKDGDKVNAQVWIGNGYSQKKANSTYDSGSPETIPVDKSTNPVFTDALTGATIGSRIAITAPADKIFGPGGNAQLDIGNKDPVLIIIDAVSEYTTPKPKDVSSKWLPSVVEKQGEPVALDFKGLPKPKADGDLRRSIIKQGKGETVTDSMTVTANYLGQVYGAKKPFDESYSKQPVPFSLQSVVKGWTYGLSGVKVGSRVLLEIPPSLGYGAQAQPNIPANSTLYFVVDIISAK
jgi:peptidylprolyl isomerase